MRIFKATKLNSLNKVYNGKTSKIRSHNPYTDNWFEIAKRVKNRDGNKCVKCGSSDKLDVHHIIPVSKGGKTNEANLITLCHTHHKKQPGHTHLK